MTGLRPHRALVRHRVERRRARPRHLRQGDERRLHAGGRVLASERDRGRRWSAAGGFVHGFTFSHHPGDRRRLPGHARHPGAGGPRRARGRDGGARRWPGSRRAARASARGRRARPRPPARRRAGGGRGHAPALPARREAGGGGGRAALRAGPHRVPERRLRDGDGGRRRDAGAAVRGDGRRAGRDGGDPGRRDRDGLADAFVRPLRRRHAMPRTMRDYPSIVVPAAGPARARGHRARRARDVAELPQGLPAGGRPRARGAVVEDVDGNRYLDFAAGIAVASTGHCHPDVVAAIKRAVRAASCTCAPPTSTTRTWWRWPRGWPAARPGPGPWRVFFANSGAEVVEARDQAGPPAHGPAEDRGLLRRLPRPHLRRHEPHREQARPAPGLRAVRCPRCCTRTTRTATAAR